MCAPGRLNDHIRVLAERFSQVARDSGHEPERLGLDGRELEARAESVLSNAVERFGREERDSHELGRLEARMILACAVRDEAAARQQALPTTPISMNGSITLLTGAGVRRFAKSGSPTTRRPTRQRDSSLRTPSSISCARSTKSMRG